MPPPAPEPTDWEDFERRTGLHDPDRERMVARAPSRGPLPAAYQRVPGLATHPGQIGY